MSLHPRKNARAQKIKEKGLGETSQTATCFRRRQKENLRRWSQKPGGTWPTRKVMKQQPVSEEDKRNTE